VRAVGWQGAQDVKRSERPRPVSAGAAARNHARTYDMELLTLTVPRRLTLGRQRVSLSGRNASKICSGAGESDKTDLESGLDLRPAIRRILLITRRVLLIA